MKRTDLGDGTYAVGVAVYPGGPSAGGTPGVGAGNPITRRDSFTAAQTNQALVTVSAGFRIVVTRLLVTLDKDCSVTACGVRIGFGATTPTGGGVVGSHPGSDPGGGLATGDGSGVIGMGADGEALRVTSEVATGGSVDIVTTYYTLPTT